ncbi:Hypothetical protein NTJ_07075 [Nesidiocoris tenuis]|uniref:Uncharacterized protein n=1 Tax=Nesidiocoris tenuis TaxID=355587 RepID=A0ABN7APW6_9HEMI|nr:Hypothetical protein NTJ_07075 [Nesidiocoris tenuis]
MHRTPEKRRMIKIVSALQKFGVQKPTKSLDSLYRPVHGWKRQKNWVLRRIPGEKERTDVQKRWKRLRLNDENLGTKNDDRGRISLSVAFGPGELSFSLFVALLVFQFCR